MLIALIATLASLISFVSTATNSCGHIYLQSSEHGIAVIAGRNFASGDVIESTYGVPLYGYVSLKTVLRYYTYNWAGKSQEVSQPSGMMYFGFIMLYNHNDTGNVALYVPPNYEGMAHVVAERDIMAGEEIFNRYGSDKWFQLRGLQQTVATVRSISSGYILPGCPHLYTEVTPSMKLVAAKSITSGQIIEVARALILPAVRLLQSSVDPFVWYREHSSLGAMLVLGNGAFYGSPGPNELPNVHYQWYKDPSWGEEKICDEYMLVSFTATRDIAVGEILNIPLNLEYDAVSQLWRKRIVDSMLEIHCF